MCVACLRNHVDITEGIEIGDFRLKKVYYSFFLLKFFHRHSKASYNLLLSELRALSSTAIRMDSMFAGISRIIGTVLEKIERFEGC